MSHFAKIENGIVTQVIVAEQDFIDSGVVGNGWIQTSYNTLGNVHYGQDGNPDGGIPLSEVLDDVNIYSPLEYPSKMDNILHKPELKRINFIAMHEAREIIPSKKWQNFLTMAVNDISATNRVVKRLVTFVVSQSIGDVTSDTRKMINYYLRCERWNYGSPKTKVYIEAFWMDERDKQKIKLKTRGIKGLLRLPDGRLRSVKPICFEITRPNHEIVKRFKQSDFLAKSKTIQAKLNKILSALKAELGTEQNKIDAIVNWYVKLPESLKIIGKKAKDHWVVKKEVVEIHNILLSDAPTWD